MSTYKPMIDVCRGCAQKRLIAVDRYCSPCWRPIKESRNDGYSAEFPCCATCGDKLLYWHRKTCTFCDFEAADITYTNPDAQGWWDYARCKGEDTERFFPTSGNPTVLVKVCGQCPVKEDCLAEAMSKPQGDDHGIWGGTTAEHRIRLRRKLAEEAA